MSLQATPEQLARLDGFERASYHEAVAQARKLYQRATELEETIAIVNQQKRPSHEFLTHLHEQAYSAHYRAQEQEDIAQAYLDGLLH